MYIPPQSHHNLHCKCIFTNQNLGMSFNFFLSGDAQICFCLPQTCIFHIKVFNFLNAFILLNSLSKMDKTFPVLKSHFFHFFLAMATSIYFYFFICFHFFLPGVTQGLPEHRMQFLALLPDGCGLVKIICSIQWAASRHVLWQFLGNVLRDEHNLCFILSSLYSATRNMGIGHLEP